MAIFAMAYHEMRYEQTWVKKFGFGELCAGRLMAVTR